jgi:transglutaminase-like putative cysteine protease
MRFTRLGLWLRAAFILGLAVVSPASAGTPGAILHEPLPPDASEDLAMQVTVAGDLPAAIQTPSGIVSAPDPRSPTSPAGSAYGAADDFTFRPDRNTQRPEVTGYDEPFTPSTAPFKRLDAYDAVRPDYQLYVRDTRLVALPPGAAAGADDDAFYADLVVDLAPGRTVRIPSVGPGARVVRAHVGVGADDFPFKVMHDGADNWFLQATVRAPVRARAVMELAIARGAFGGQMGNPSWHELPFVPPLPDNVARDAAQVSAAIGVSRAQRPREVTARLVQYFRGFADSNDPPQGHGSVYLDLALSKKGVCRHRSFAFLVTAQSLGIPTRLVQNEAHAWVEVHDGTLWRRIDLGGAGHMVNPESDASPERTVYRPPPDAFTWPQNAERGDDMVADARARANAGGTGRQGAGSGGGASTAASGGPSKPSPASPARGTASTPEPPGIRGGEDRDERPRSAITLTLDDADAHRGLPLHIRGRVRADNEPCPHVAVEILLRDPAARPERLVLVGTVATGDDGAFVGGIVVPAATPLGDYDAVARTPGDARCGPGSSQ